MYESFDSAIPLLRIYPTHIFIHVLKNIFKDIHYIIYSDKAGNNLSVADTATYPPIAFLSVFSLTAELPS